MKFSLIKIPFHHWTEVFSRTSSFSIRGHVTPSWCSKDHHASEVLNTWVYTVLSIKGKQRFAPVGLDAGCRLWNRLHWQSSGTQNPLTFHWWLFAKAKVAKTNIYAIYNLSSLLFFLLFCSVPNTHPPSSEGRWTQQCFTVISVIPSNFVLLLVTISLGFNTFTRESNSSTGSYPALCKKLLLHSGYIFVFWWLKKVRYNSGAVGIMHLFRGLLMLMKLM